MFKIGFRTIKTAIGTALSILIAQFLHLENFLSAGILTVLCIQNTKKKSLRSAWDRFLACQVGMLFSFLFFEGFGYQPLSITLLLLFFIPTLVMLKAAGGVVTSTVIILHFYAAKEISIQFITEEYKIMFIGIGVALLLNMYMPSAEKYLKQYQIEVEDHFKIIFKEIVKYLRTYDTSWTGKDLIETVEVLKKAKSLAFKNAENYLFKTEDYYFHYFEMREKQLEIIERVLPIVTSISYNVDQAKVVADFIEELSESIHPGNTANKYLKKLNDMQSTLSKMNLPKSRAEFEALSALHHFVKEMEQYLYIKSALKIEN